jgi:carbonic anhydrase
MKEVVLTFSDCGLTLITDEHAKKTLGDRSHTELAKYDLEMFCFTEYDYKVRKLQLLNLCSVPKSVRDDVDYLRAHPFIRKETKISGCVYDTETGKLERVRV